MICEVRGDEVILKNPKISDILCFVWLTFHKDKEICFSPPKEAQDADDKR